MKSRRGAGSAELRLCAVVGRRHADSSDSCSEYAQRNQVFTKVCSSLSEHLSRFYLHVHYQSSNTVSTVSGSTVLMNFGNSEIFMEVYPRYTLKFILVN